MNQITVIGRVSTDVELRDVGGSNVANFNVAAGNSYKDKNTGAYGTNFYRVSAWGRDADTASRFLKKGHRVGISGELIIRTYAGNDGVQKTAVEIRTNKIDLIETKAEADGSANAAAPAAPATPAPAQGGFTPVETDELPF